MFDIRIRIIAVELTHGTATVCTGGEESKDALKLQAAVKLAWSKMKQSGGKV